jgi:phosphomannomutase
MDIKINTLSQQTGVKFGTSGVRGLVIDMTDQVCVAYVAAFLQYLKNKQLIHAGDKVGIAGDLRSSTPRIMNAVAAACEEMGFVAINYGFIPSPAIALFGIESQIATIMVTGSHIPDDRNGIKLNTPYGEILKDDEQGILQQQITLDQSLFDSGDQLIKHDYLPKLNDSAEKHYIQRYKDFFESDALKSKKIGLYAHSSVATTCLHAVCTALGAEVTLLAPSEKFIPVDTEAIREIDVALAHQWAKEYQFDAIVSTDGDGDRPLVSDENGNWLRGDVAGVLCASYLEAKNVVTPVSSNSLIEKTATFKQVVRTKIGSPFVIAAMQSLAINGELDIVGYEANGGFLQQTPLKKNGKTLAPLPTRDAVIVALTVIALSEQYNGSISTLLAQLPQRYTYSDRLKEFPTELSAAKIASINSGNLAADLAMFTQYFPTLATPTSIDATDGVRVTLQDGDVVHLRPSGNAPELRCYTESNSVDAAKNLNQYCMSVMQGWH